MIDRKSAGIGKGTPGPGRGKGTPNKITKATRELFRDALDELGGTEWIVKMAKSKGKGALTAKMAVLTAFTKLLPHEIVGKDSGPIQVIVETIDPASLRD